MRRASDMLRAAGAAAVPVRSGAGARSFTLIEVMVAIGAVALIAVGLASVFASVGDTVRSGRRLSVYNQYVAALEQHMRRDFSGMSREAPLVILHEYANEGRPVPLYPGQPESEWRPRRIDQLVFFTRGEFVSARRPLSPGIVPRSDVVRVWYGQPKRRLFNAQATGPYVRPTLNDKNDESAATLGLDNEQNPNRFAADWTLARQQVLLRQPLVAATDGAPGPVLGVGPNDPILADADTQVAMQPAAISLFRVLQPLVPLQLTGGGRQGSGGGGGPVRTLRGNVRPLLSSGMVDIATTDLGEVRTVVNDAPKYGIVPGSVPRNLAAFDNALASALQSPPPQPSDLNDVEDVVRGQHAWMRQLFPGVTGGGEGDWDEGVSFTQRTRPRAEPSTTGFFAATDPSLSARLASQLQSDQLMLFNGNLIPGCTEFIVEWSYGLTYTAGPQAGQIVWHGRDRRLDTDQNGTPDWTAAQPYDHTDRDNDAVTAFETVGGSIDERLINAGLVHGWAYFSPDPNGAEPSFPDDQSQGDRATLLFSYFGYDDPTFQRDRATASRGLEFFSHLTAVDEDSDGNFVDPNDAAAQSIPWPWPKLVRVTLSFADPEDPAVELTYQVVFDVGGSGPGGGQLSGTGGLFDTAGSYIRREKNFVRDFELQGG